MMKNHIISTLKLIKTPNKHVKIIEKLDIKNIIRVLMVENKRDLIDIFIEKNIGFNTDNLNDFFKIISKIKNSIKDNFDNTDKYLLYIINKNNSILLGDFDKEKIIKDYKEDKEELEKRLNDLEYLRFIVGIEHNSISIDNNDLIKFYKTNRTKIMDRNDNKKDIKISDIKNTGSDIVDLIIKDRNNIYNGNFKIYDHDKKIIESRKILYVFYDLETYSNENNVYLIGYDTIFFNNDKFEEVIEKYNNDIFYNEDNLLQIIYNIILRTTNIAKNNNIDKIIFIAHNGSKFDLVIIYKYLIDIADEFDIYKRDGERIDLFKMTFKNIKIEFVDFYNMTNASLKKSAESFKVEGIKKEFFPYNFVTKDSMLYIGNTPDITFFDNITIEEYNSIYTENYILIDEAKKYLKNDCLLLKKSYINFIISINKATKLWITERFTIASIAMYIYKHRFYKKEYEIYVDLPSIYNSFIKQGSYGGRCEILQYYGENVSIYDVNSLYPTVSRYYLPAGIPLFSENYKLSDYELAFCLATVEYNGEHLPVLPLRHNNKVIYPIGLFSGVWYNEELKLAAEVGYKIDIKLSLVFPKKTKSMEEYMENFYKMKSNEKDNLSPIAKRLLNSLFGKWGENINDITLKKGDNLYDYDFIFVGNEKYYFIKDPIVNYKNNPSLSAAILAEARIFLYRKITTKVKGSVIYYDTDSIFINNGYLDENEIGKEIGLFKLEKKNEEIFIKNIKQYYNKDRTFVKYKGIKVDKNFKEYDDITTFKNTRFKSNLKEGKVTIKESLYIPKKEYDARETKKIDNIIKTFPITIIKNEIIDIKPILLCTNNDTNTLHNKKIKVCYNENNNYKERFIYNNNKINDINKIITDYFNDYEKRYNSNIFIISYELIDNFINENKKETIIYDEHDRLIDTILNDIHTKYNKLIILSNDCMMLYWLYKYNINNNINNPKDFLKNNKDHNKIYWNEIFNYFKRDDEELVFIIKSFIRFIGETISSDALFNIEYTMNKLDIITNDNKLSNNILKYFIKKNYITFIKKYNSNSKYLSKDYKYNDIFKLLYFNIIDMIPGFEYDKKISINNKHKDYYKIDNKTAIYETIRYKNNKKHYINYEMLGILEHYLNNLDSDIHNNIVYPKFKWNELDENNIEKFKNNKKDKKLYELRRECLNRDLEIIKTVLILKILKIWNIEYINLKNRADHRGRFYTDSFFSPDRGDLNRALLLGPKINWKIDNEDYKILKFAICYTNMNQEEILEGVKAINNKDYEYLYKIFLKRFLINNKEKNKWTAFNYLIDINNIINNNISQINIQMDCSNSAYQIIAGITGDKELAINSNVIKSYNDYNKKDIYIIILNEIIKVYPKLSREDIKKIVMAIPYGMTPYTMAELLKNTKKFTDYECKEIRNMIIKNIENIFPSAYNLKFILQNFLKLKIDIKKYDINYVINNIKVPIWVYKENQFKNNKNKTIDLFRSINSITANTVQSLDSLLLTELYKIDNNICRTTIHDSYGVSIKDTELIINIANKAYKNIFFVKENNFDKPYDYFFDTFIEDYKEYIKNIGEKEEYNKTLELINKINNDRIKASKEWEVNKILWYDTVKKGNESLLILDKEKIIKYKK